MATWIQITSPNDNRIVPNTIGILNKTVKEKSTKNNITVEREYYIINHWRYTNKTIKELKANCTLFTSELEKVVTVDGFPTSITYRIKEYIEDYETGTNSFAPMTGVRVKIQAVNNKLTKEAGLEYEYNIYRNKLTIQ